MRFTRIKLSDIVHPVSSSKLAEIPDRVRSFRGYNSEGSECAITLQLQRPYRPHVHGYRVIDHWHRGPLTWAGSAQHSFPTTPANPNHTSKGTRILVVENDEVPWRL